MEGGDQQQTGNIFGTVVDDQGAPLPGVTVILSAVAVGSSVTATDEQGLFSFLELQPGQYTLTARLEGWTTGSYPNVNVGAGRNTELEIRLYSAVES